MQRIKKSIEIFCGEKYRNRDYGTIYYVAGTSSSQINEYVSSEMDSIEAHLNRDTGNWVRCKLVYLAANNPFFPSREQAVLYSALLPEEGSSIDTDDNAFLVATVMDCGPRNINEVFGLFFTTLQKMFDEVLDEGSYQPDHLGLEYVASGEDHIRFSAPCGMPLEKMAPASMLDRSCPSVNTPPSPLVITPNTYQVLLPDYDKEFPFTTQVKALYILFLNHPEGIRIKEIADYKKEFTHIYLHVTKWGDVDRLKVIVDQLLDVWNRNALDVKKSQCNKKIRETIPDKHLQKYYEIEVNPGEPHKINLDRALVSMPDDLRSW